MQKKKKNKSGPFMGSFETNNLSMPQSKTHGMVAQTGT
jgi:hypothetical protein